MSDDYKIQVSIKFGPNMTGMLNIRANDAIELADLADQAEVALVGSVASLTEKATALTTIGGAFPGTAVVPQQPAPVGIVAAAAAPAAPGQGPAPICQHGTRVYRSGADWQGWFCPGQRDDPTKCKAQYIR